MARGPPEGLSTAEATARLREVGPNAIQPARRRAFAFQLLRRFANPLVLLLVAASAVSAFTGDERSSLVLIVVVSLSVALDSLQEHRANRAFEALQRTAGVRATVLRDGAPVELPAEDVVPGDAVLLAAGDLVPADGEVVEAKDFFVNQALLTGEPYPVEKLAPSAEAFRPELGQVFKGSSVISGSASVRVAQTGERTQLGKIGVSISQRRRPAPFEVGARNFGLLILRLALLMILFVLLVQTVRGRPLLESLMFAIALAVGMTPELLPMVVSITLARGAVRMAKRKVLVKRLAAIHDLGSMDVLCTDKTGTLTEARIRLQQHLDAEGRDSARVLELIAVNSAFETGLRSPLDEAVLKHGKVDLTGWKKLDEVPFDFERRRVSVLAERGGERWLIVKGALEDVLRSCARCEVPGSPSPIPLDASLTRALRERFERLCAEGYRVLGVGFKREAADCLRAVVTDETELVFAGFAAFEDPPRQSAGAALAALSGIGVRVAIITGDNERVAEHLCRELGVEVTGVVRGDELEALDDHALSVTAERTNLFCRVNPAQKTRVLQALRRRGHVVGFLGDGINDAPALHAADVGISVDSAVDVAKDAADLILLEHDLAVVRDGVLEGRATLGNILKYVMMATSSNFGNMFSMAGASLLLPFLPMLPVQIIANNFLYDLSELPIPTDRVEPEFAREPHRWDVGFIRRFMLWIGPVSSLFDFATFALLLLLFDGDERMFHTGWFVESLATQVLVIFVIRTRANPFRFPPSRLLAATSLAVVAAAVVLPFTQAGNALGFSRPPPLFFALIAPLVGSYLCAVELTKRFFYRRYSLHRARPRAEPLHAASRPPDRCGVDGGLRRPHRAAEERE